MDIASFIRHADALWSLVIQIGLDGAALIVGIRLLMAVNQNMNNHGNNED